MGLLQATESLTSTVVKPIRTLIVCSAKGLEEADPKEKEAAHQLR